MENILTDWNPWHWGIAALVFLILELFLPSTFFLWLGVSAVAVAACLWVFPEASWQLQWSGFWSIFIGRHYSLATTFKAHPDAQPTNRH